MVAAELNRKSDGFCAGQQEASPTMNAPTVYSSPSQQSPPPQKDQLWLASFIY
jgi:hypothetical protein